MSSAQSATPASSADTQLGRGEARILWSCAHPRGGLRLTQSPRDSNFVPAPGAAGRGTPPPERSALGCRPLAAGRVVISSGVGRGPSAPRAVELGHGEPPPLLNSVSWSLGSAQPPTPSGESTPPRSSQDDLHRRAQGHEAEHVPARCVLLLRAVVHRLHATAPPTDARREDIRGSHRQGARGVPTSRPPPPDVT